MSKTGVESKRCLNEEKHAATKEWIDSVQEDEDEAELESIGESIVESSDCDYETDTDDGATVSTKALGTQMAPNPNEINNITQSIKELLNSINSIQTVGNVKIENSTGVHIGNITNINGNIQIIHPHPGDGFQQRSKRKSNAYRNRKSSPSSNLPPKPKAEGAERVHRDAFIDRIKFKIPKELCSIIPRRTWLAQLPLEDYDYMQEPVKYVVISHTATESSQKQALNIRLIRHIQCFHIESNEWNDIAYNYLVGDDGNVYEGRGWGVVGAHTMGYNNMSIGISFIGCFMRVLPTEAALNACKNLLKRGVAEGHLSSEYKLICHCQCRSTESPGRKLFEEIQKWEHFHNIEEDQ